MLKIVFLALFALMGGAEASWIKATCSIETVDSESKRISLISEQTKISESLRLALDEVHNDPYHDINPKNNDICYAMCEYYTREILDSKPSVQFYIDSCEEMEKDDQSQRISASLLFGLYILKAKKGITDWNHLLSDRDENTADSLKKWLKEANHIETLIEENGGFQEKKALERTKRASRGVLSEQGNLKSEWRQFDQRYQAASGHELNRLLITEFRRAVASGIIVLDYRKIPDGRGAGEYGFEWGFSQAVGDILNSEISSDLDFLNKASPWVKHFRSSYQVKSALRIVMRGAPQAAARVAAGSAAALGYFFTSAAPSSFDVQIADNPLSYFKFNQSDTVIGYFDERGKERFRNSMLTLLFLLQTFNAASQH